jgi:hypothetical protein
MNGEQRATFGPRWEQALDEIQVLIRDRYPTARFNITEGEDPSGLYLVATVDVEDMGEVVEVFLDRLVDFQVDDELPVYVLLARPRERNAAILARTDPKAAALVVL